MASVIVSIIVRFNVTTYGSAYTYLIILLDNSEDSAFHVLTSS
jgi:hypothetical protein